jgi:pimeloyl-ACP methyl ester carboxylesterase
MSGEKVSVVLVHGAWADGTSWAKVIGPLTAQGIKVIAAPLPLTTFAEDVAAVERTLERVSGPVVLAAHAYAGAIIAATRNGKVKALVYVAALAPDEGETVGDVFYREASFAGSKVGARQTWTDLSAGRGTRGGVRAECLRQ